MLPIYVAYFAGTSNDLLEERGDSETATWTTFRNALGFVVGFTIVFVVLGALSGTIGTLLASHQRVLDIVCGIIVIIFGLYFAGVLHIGFLDRTVKPDVDIRPRGFLSATLFGIVFALGWTPCVGAFLGSALLLASQQGSTLIGVLLLLTYSAGLGIPFLLAAVLIEKIGGAFDAIKRHYRVITIICGVLLIVVGVLMMLGMMNIWLAALGSL